MPGRLLDEFSTNSVNFSGRDVFFVVLRIQELIPGGAQMYPPPHQSRTLLALGCHVLLVRPGAEDSLKKIKLPKK